jgi:hypothetical protein
MKRIVIALFLMSHFLFFGQEKEVEVFKKHHTLGFMLSHTNVNQGIKDGDKSWLSLPSFALDYNYVFSSKWSIGLHNDIIIENLKLKTAPLIVSPTAYFFYNFIYSTFSSKKVFILN